MGHPVYILIEVLTVPQYPYLKINYLREHMCQPKIDTDRK